MLSVIGLSVAIYFLLCWFSLCWMPLCWVSWRHLDTYTISPYVIRNSTGGVQYARGDHDSVAISLIRTRVYLLGCLWHSSSASKIVDPNKLEWLYIARFSGRSNIWIKIEALAHWVCHRMAFDSSRFIAICYDGHQVLARLVNEDKNKQTKIYKFNNDIFEIK